MAADRQGCKSCREDQRVMGIAKSCDGCRHNVPDPKGVMQENREAVTVFMICWRQWLVGINGAYAIDGNFVWKVMKDQGVANKTETFSRVDTLAAHYLKVIRKK